MTPDMFERLQAQLAALEPEIKNMRGTSPGFVRDQIARVASYGVNVRMSPKQQQWLDDLYEEYVGPLDALPDLDAEPAGRDEVLNGDDDPDDELPF